MADLDAIAKSEQRRLEAVLESAQLYIDRDDLSRLSSGEAVAVPQDHTDFSKVRMIHLKKLVYSAEDIHNQILSIFHTLSGISQSCFLLQPDARPEGQHAEGHAEEGGCRPLNHDPSPFP